MSPLNCITIQTGLADRRTRHQIECEIAEELQFHQDQLSTAFQETGLSEQAAQHAALDRMGDIDTYQRQSRRIIMRERIVVKGVVVSLLAGLLIFVVVWGVSFARVLQEPTAPGMNWSPSMKNPSPR